MPHLGFAGALVIAATALLLSDRSAAQTIDELHDAGKFREVAVVLEVAATAGERSAQERVGLMYFYGELLYGPAFPRDCERAAYWLGKAAGQGSDVARYALSKYAMASSLGNCRGLAAN